MRWCCTEGHPSMPGTLKYFLWRWGVGKQSGKIKRNMKGVVLSVLFKCFKEGKVKAYLSMALLSIDTVNRQQCLQ